MTTHLNSVARSTLIALLITHLSCANTPSSNEARQGNEPVDVMTHTATLNPPSTPGYSQPSGPAVPVKYSARTTEDGASEITIPLWTPPGRRGVEPSLAVVYNSRRGHGLLGLGADLAGLSQISRCWKTLAQDGAFTDEEVPDEFCLDGTRLVRQALNAREFRPEGNPSIKVTSNGGSESAPEFFELRTKEGLIRTFGAREATSAAQVATETPDIVTNDTDRATVNVGPRRIMAWKQDSLQDLWGNTLEIDYSRTSQALGRVEVVPREIRYTRSATNGTQPSRRIRFGYRTATQSRASTSGLVTVDTTQVIDRISIDAEHRVTAETNQGSMAVFREYRFTYVANQTGQRIEDRLATIAECYGPGALSSDLSCSEPLVFDWSSPGPEVPNFSSRVVGPAVAYTHPLAAAAMELVDSAVGDFDGDGFDDYLLRIPSLGANGAPIATVTSGAVYFSAKWLLAKGSASGLMSPVPVPGLPGSSTSSPEFSPRVLDFDRDGKDEVVLVFSSLPEVHTAIYSDDSSFTTASNKHYDIFSFSTSTGNFSSNGVGETFSMAYAAGFPIRSFAFLAGDIDGDLRPDIVRGLGTTCAATAGSSERCPVFTSPFVRRTSSSTGIGFGNPTTVLGSTNGGANLAFVAGAGQEQFVVDVNGDGAPEILTREAAPPYGFDGLTPTLRSFSARRAGPRETALHADLMQPSRTAEIALGAGCAFSTQAISGLTRYFADVDGDGLTDSLALPSLQRDNCVTVRDWVGTSFLSRNVGGRFLPASFERLTEPRALIGPALLQGPTGFVDINGTNVPPVDWQSSLRSVDNGLRIADLNRDGRADLVLMGDYKTNLFTNTVVRSNPVVRFGTSAGSFGASHDIPSVQFETNGYYSYLHTNGGGVFTSGRGPRDRRLADFNGDGLVDFARIALADLSFVLIEDRQAASPADAISVVRGAGANTHIRRTSFEYEFGGPTSSVYTSQQNCPASQRCIQKVGWLVKRQVTEAGNFDAASPISLIETYMYGDARADLNGRGWLGFSTRTVDVPSRGIRSLVSRSRIQFSLGGPRYTYATTESSTMTAPVQAGERRTTSSLSPSLITDQSCAFRVMARESTQEILEASTLVANATSTSSYDALGNVTTTETVTTDGIRTETRRTQLSGTNAVDPSKWLISRYPTVLTSSTTAGSTVTRALSIAYLGSTADVASIGIETSAPVETGTTSGFARSRLHEYDAFGNLTRVTDRADARAGAPTYPDRVVALTMDSRDALFPVQVVNAAGHMTKSYFESGTGLLIGSDDENDVRTMMAYDRALRPTTIYEPTGEVISLTYSAPSASSRLRTTRHSSDTYGLRVVDRDPLGRVVRDGRTEYQIGTVYRDFVYDVNSLLTATSLPYKSGKTPAFIDLEYDSIGRLVAERRPGEAPSSPKFERRWEFAARRVDSFSERNTHRRSDLDFAGREVQNTTWVAGRPIVTSKAYGPFGLLTSISHPPLNVAMNPAPPSTQLITTFGYDVLGRIEEVIDPDSGLETRRYTPFGEVKRSTDANLGVTTQTFDNLGRTTVIETNPTVHYPVPPSATSSHAQRSVFAWDGAVYGKGKLQSATSVDGVTNLFTYDARSRVATESVDIQGEGTFHFGYAYDNKSRVSHSLLPAAASGAPVVTLEHTYSGLTGELESVVDSTVSSSPELLWALVSRNAAGQATEEQFGPNGTGSVLTRVFDSSFHLRVQESKNAATNSVFQRLSYKWGPDQLLSRKSDLIVGLQEEYTHDDLNRLTEWSVRQNCRISKWEYSYDDWGNLRTRKLDGSLRLENRYTRAGVAGPAHGVKELVDGAAAETYDYLPAGQVSSGGSNSFMWRPFGLPSSVSSTNGSASQYRYDAFGRRVLEVSSSSSGTRRIITLGSRYEKRTDNSGGATHSYGISDVGQLRRVTNSAGTLLSRQVQYFHSDQLGSPDVISANGGVLDRVKYEPFGERRHSWAVVQPMASAHTVSPSVGFTGHQPDDAFGLTNMRGRIYLPRSASFQSPDPFLSARPGGLSRFSYVRNSPIQLVDPSGFIAVNAALTDLVIGPSGGDGPGMDSDRYEATQYTTIIVGTREPTSDASSSSISISSIEGVALDPADLAADLLANSFATYSGGLGSFDSVTRPIVAGMAPKDWERVTNRLAALRAFGALEHFVRVRREVSAESDRLLYGAGLRGSVSTAKFWADIAALQGIATLGVTVLYRNQMPTHFARELAEAHRVGARVSIVSSEAELAVAAASSETGTLKYVVRETGEIVVAPKFVLGVEVKHSVLAGSEDAAVLAAGEIEVSAANGKVFASQLNTSSGHFKPNPESESVAKAAFQAIGVVFP